MASLISSPETVFEFNLLYISNKSLLNLVISNLAILQNELLNE